MKVVILASPALVSSIERGSTSSCQVGKFRRQLMGTWSPDDCPVTHLWPLHVPIPAEKMEAGTGGASRRSRYGASVCTCVFL